MGTEEAIKIKSISILRIEIENSWYIEDFYDVFDSIDRLYVYYSIIAQALNRYDMIGKDLLWDEKFKSLPDFFSLTNSFKRIVFDIYNYYRPYEKIFYKYSTAFTAVKSLQIHKISFGSKGSIDILGVGQIFDILKDLIINYIPSKEKKLDTLIKQKEVEEKEQKILQMKIDNLKKLGLKNDEIISIIGFESLHLSRLGKLAENKKITNLTLEKFIEQ